MRDDVPSCVVAIVGGIALALYFGLRRARAYWRRRGVPQLGGGHPVYGNGEDLIKGRTPMPIAYRTFYRKFKAARVACGGIYLGLTKRELVPVDPDAIGNVMQKDFDHFAAHFPPGTHPSIFSRGLFHMEGEPWRRMRRKLTPTFTTGKMRMMFETLAEKSDGLRELAGRLASAGEAVDIKEVLGRFTTDVIGSCAFGLECNSLEDPDSEFRTYGKSLFVRPPPRETSDWDVLVAALRSRLGPPRRDPGAFGPLEEFFTKVVSDTIEYREKNGIYRKDFMHLMIQLKNRGIVADDERILGNETDKEKHRGDTLSVYEIVPQCLLFFIAGYETSATTMTFALLLLAQHQDVQEKVRKEANEILEKHGGKFTYEAMMEMTYAENVIQETLRLYPPVSVIPRVCTKDYTIPGTDAVIEKGTVVQIPVLGLHTDPDYFPDPDKFDPERFNHENKSKIRDFTYMPFGEGPRMCLGLRFGLMQSKIGLVSLVRDYNFTLNERTIAPLRFQKGAFISAVEGDGWLDIEKV